jgi:hypothetical protein
VYLRGRVNSLKRVLIHVAALNLGLLMCVIVGVAHRAAFRAGFALSFHHCQSCGAGFPT